MRERYCFWSVATRQYAEMAQSLVDSARRVGMFKDFHLWTDRPVEGAVCHPIGKSGAKQRFIQLELLHKQVRKLNYEYYVWLDADSYFVRHPGDLLRVLKGAPIHASLASDAAQPKPVHPDWGPISLSNFTTLMRFCGVRSRGIFTVNKGFWIVHRDVIDTFCGLTWDFWRFSTKVGYRFTFEPLLAFATQMLCGNPYVHTLKHTADIWASDLRGSYAGRVPDSVRWRYLDYFSGESFMIRPAIVHAVQSKRALVALARHRRTLPGPTDRL